MPPDINVIVESKADNLIASDLQSTYLDGKRVRLPWLADQKQRIDMVLKRFGELVYDPYKGGAWTRGLEKSFFPADKRKILISPPLNTIIPPLNEFYPTKQGFRFFLREPSPPAPVSAGEFCGLVTVDFYRPPQEPIDDGRVCEGKVHPSAVNEVTGGGRPMAQALRWIFKGLVTGRTAPGATNVNHIHVGGDAHKNILFSVSGENVVLGVVDGHMDSAASPSVKKKSREVTERANSRGTATVYVLNDIHLVPKQ